MGCTHYPLLRPIIARLVGDRIAIVDSATATSSALAELLAVNGLEAPARPGAPRPMPVPPVTSGRMKPRRRSRIAS
ncbi:MAG: hypothetical protein WKF78_13665 [Candidatus Limnocylindrales bacterium]